MDVAVHYLVFQLQKKKRLLTQVKIIKYMSNLRFIIILITRNTTLI